MFLGRLHLCLFTTIFLSAAVCINADIFERSEYQIYWEEKINPKQNMTEQFRHGSCKYIKSSFTTICTFS